MKSHSFQRLLLPAALMMAAQSLCAADVVDAQAPAADAQDTSAQDAVAEQDLPAPIANDADRDGMTTVEVTPKLFFHDYFSGSGVDRIRFLERYNYQQGLADSSRSDLWLDADFRLKISDGERDLLSIERLVSGRYSHRNKVRVDREQVGITGYFQQFRSATGRVDYLFSPGQVAGGTDPSYFFPAQTNANSGYIAQFNDDSQDRNFNIKRSSYGLGVKLKPALFQGYGSFAVKYDGYERDGSQFYRYALGGGDIRQAGTNASTAGRVLQRWRGFDQQVDENNRRVSLTAMVTPGNLLQVAYDFSWDKFDNNARNGTHADVSQSLPAQWQYNTGGDSTRPLGFVPDSNLLSHGLRVSRTFGNLALAAGYGQSRLEQDTFTQPQQRLGFDTGKISTDNAFLNFSSNLFSGVGLEGFYKYYRRDNDSSFPVPRLLDPAGHEQLGVRINRIESNSFGLNASFRSRALKSSFMLGWKHEDKERNLTFADSTLGPPAANGISAERSFYSERTEYDEVSLRMMARLGKGLNLRVTPSYLWASRTALVTDPREQVKVKASLTYVSPGGTFFNGYYNYAGKRNNEHSLLGTDGVLVTQDMDRTATSAGVSMSLTPSEWITAQVAFSWLQDDFSALFFGSNRRRYEAPGNTTLFFLRDGSSYNVDTYMFSAGGDWRVSDALTYTANYTYTQSTGNTASGLILGLLPRIDGRIDNAVSSLALGVQYQASPRLRWSGHYILDYYNDDVFGQLSGGMHSVMVGLTYGFY